MAGLGARIAALEKQFPATPPQRDPDRERGFKDLFEQLGMEWPPAERDDPFEDLFSLIEAYRREYDSKEDA